MNDTLLHTVGSSASLSTFFFWLNSWYKLLAVDGLPFGGIGPSGCRFVTGILVTGCLYVPQLGIIQGNTRLICSRTFARRLTTLACSLFFPLASGHNLILFFFKHGTFPVVTVPAIRRELIRDECRVDRFTHTH